MKKILLDSTKNQYRANLHCHTTISDGKFTPEEIKQEYKAHGYSVVAFTDHDVMLPHHDLTDVDFVALTGFETEINEIAGGLKPTDEHPFHAQKCCHICMIALDRDNDVQPLFNPDEHFVGKSGEHKHLVKYDKTKPLYVRKYTDIEKYMKEGRECGFFVTYNHPSWSMQDYSDYMQYKSMHAMEISNFGCLDEGYDDYNPRVYDDILRGGTKIFAIGADDNHSKAHMFGGYIQILADRLDYNTITKSLTDGNFYAVTGDGGPEIYELSIDGLNVNIKCSACKSIAVTTGIRRAYIQKGDNLTEATFELHPKSRYFRLTLTDNEGRKTDTNAYFI